MKKYLFLLPLLILLLTGSADAGTTSTNGYFYLPAVGASGDTERATWLAVQEATDAVIKANADKTSNATHTGEVTGSTALTIADSVTVDDWTLGDSATTTLNNVTITVPAVGSTLTIQNSKTLTVTDDATISGTPVDEATTAGRNLTLSTYDVGLDSEIYTESMGAYIENLTAAEDFDNIFFKPNPITITGVWCWSNTSTTTLNIENASDNDVLSSDIVCDVGGQSACASGCDVDTVDTGEDNLAAFAPANISVTSVAAANTTVVHVRYTIDD